MNLNASEIISLIILRIGRRINFINLCPVPETGIEISLIFIAQLPGMFDECWLELYNSSHRRLKSKSVK